MRDAKRIAVIRRGKVVGYGKYAAPHRRYEDASRQEMPAAVSCTMGFPGARSLTQNSGAISLLERISLETGPPSARRFPGGRGLGDFVFFRWNRLARGRDDLAAHALAYVLDFAAAFEKSGGLLFDFSLQCDRGRLSIVFARGFFV